MAIPKGRIAKELEPLLNKIGIKPDADFYDENSRKLQFTTSAQTIDLIRVRSFDVATFVAYGGAQIGIAGNDVLEEFDYAELYTPVDLGIGRCRLSVAELASLASEDDPSSWSSIRVATKYPNLTKKYFAKRGVQAECIKLNGAMEIAPKLGLCRRIVDLVSTGKTLAENGLVEVETILEVTSRLIVNRTAYKTRNTEISNLIEQFS